MKIDKETLTKLNIPYEDVLEIDNIFTKDIVSQNGSIQEVLKYLSQVKGKRVRPIICFFIYYAFAKDIKNKKDIINAAVSIELLHNSTLLHDDVIDKDEKRRNINTVNYKWDNKTSILVGDFVLTQSLKFILKIQDLNIIQVLLDSTVSLVEGEFLQMKMEKNISYATVEEYYKVVSLKTSSLFILACKIGFILSGNKTDAIGKIVDFGTKIGIVFQILDDISDYNGSDFFGKNTGSDFAGCKVTLPLILAYCYSSIEQKKTIEYLLKDPECQQKNSFSKIKKIMQDTNSIEKAKKIALEITNEAIEIIKEIKKDFSEESLLYFMNLLLKK